MWAKVKIDILKAKSTSSQVQFNRNFGRSKNQLRPSDLNFCPKVMLDLDAIGFINIVRTWLILGMTEALLEVRLRF